MASASDTLVYSGLAIKSYIDNLITGLKWKQSVACATTANITLSGEQTIDGVTTSGSRVLVRSQSTASQNGIYVSGDGSWTRATDADAGAELVNATVFVEGGTTYADTQWTCTNNSITIGSTSITWAQVSGSGTYSAGTGLVLTGNQFSIASTVVTSTYSGAVGITGSLDVDNLSLDGNTYGSDGNSTTDYADFGASGKIRIFGTSHSSAGTIQFLNSAGTVILNINTGTNGWNFQATGSLSGLSAVSAGSFTSTGNISAGGDLSGEALSVSDLTNQLILGTTNTTTISATAPSASRVYTLPDWGANDSFVGLAASQTLTNKTINGSNNTINNIAISTAVSGLGTGVATALAVNTGTAGAFAVMGGAGSFTTLAATGDLTLTSGKQTRGANGRTIVLDKTVTLTDATLTTIATLTLPTGSSLGGAYTVEIKGMLVLGGSGTGSIGGKRLEATVSFGQDASAISSEGVKTTSSTGVSFGDALGGRDVSLTAISVAISGTDNSTHAIQLNVDGTGSTGGNPNFIGTITVHHIGFTSFSAS
jgi:hypothetical protein